MYENKSYIKINKSSERNFGLVFVVFFSIIGLAPIYFNQNIKLWALIIAIILLIISYFSPKLLKKPSAIWLKIGDLIGIITSPIIMLLIYVLTIVPLGLIIRVFNKDLIKAIEKLKDSLTDEESKE